MDIITQIAKEYGLFVALVAYILWFFDKLIKTSREENAVREARYIAVIDKLSDSFSELTKEVEAIKTMMQNDHEEIKKKVATK